MPENTSNMDNDDRIIRMPDLDYDPDPRGIGYVFYSSMKMFKDKVAQIDSVTGEKDTYQSLLQRCVRTAIKMRSIGITDKDIVTVCTFNHFNSYVPYIGGLFLGAKVCALDPTLNVQEAIELFKQIVPKIIFVSVEGISLIEKIISETKQNIKVVVFGSLNKYTNFQEFLEPNAEEDNFQPFPAKSLLDTALILFSSGTTGLPKGICIHHYGYLGQIRNQIDYKFCIDLCIIFLPSYWVSSIKVLGDTIVAGTTRLLVPKYEPDILLDVIQKFRPTYISAAPFHYYSLYKTWNENIDTSSVLHIAVGGSPYQKPHKMAIEKIFPTSQIHQAYGQTEMIYITTIFKPNDLRDMELQKTKTGSCGTGIPGVWYKIVDLDTEELLGPNQPGELRIKTNLCLKGYYNQDSSHVFDKDGWFKTGDLMYYDEDKCFYVVERLSELLKYQAWNIAPAFLENIIKQHPEVANAVVIGIPDDIDENHLMGVVVLKDQNSKIKPEEIEKYVEARVDERKRLRAGVKIVGNIPFSATGKVKRRDIRNKVLNNEL